MPLELDPIPIHSTSYLTLFNKRPIGNELLYTSEAYQIPSVTSPAPFTGYPFIRLREAPLQSFGVTIPGYTEDTLGPPGSFQFTVDYANGFITFNTANIGATVLVTYKGRGSIILAQDINLITAPLVPFYNKLNTIVPDGPATPNFTFPDNVTVTGNLTVLGTAITRQTIIATASQTVFNLSFNINSDNLLVYKQGLLATEGGGADYTVTGTTPGQITFNTGRPLGEIENFVRIG
jgi:hypothetical protein